MNEYEYIIETIDVIIDSLNQTKKKLECNDVLADDLYGSFDILNLIYVSMIDLFGEEQLEIFQKNYINHVIKILKEKILMEGILLSTIVDDGFYLIKVSLFLNGTDFDICYLNPYFKSIILIKDESTIEYEEKIDQLYEIEKNISEQIYELQMAKENPIYYAKEDSVLLAKMTLQKKKYKKIIEEELNNKYTELMNLKREIAELISDYNIDNEEKTEVNFYKNQYVNKLVNYFNFSLVKEEKNNVKGNNREEKLKQEYSQNVNLID